MHIVPSVTHQGQIRNPSNVLFGLTEIRAANFPIEKFLFFFVGLLKVCEIGMFTVIQSETVSHIFYRFGHFGRFSFHVLVVL